MTIEGATDTAVFHAYVREILVPALRPGDIVIMDNLGAHKNDRTVALITAAGANVRFLPAYSPDLNPIEMSGGEQQRLAIARAIVNRPAILIADEPTANLDQESARRIMEVFRDFNRVGVTTLIASHDRALMASYATRTLRIEQGKFTDLHGVQA